MKQLHLALAIAACLVQVACSQITRADDRLSWDEFKTLHSELKPKDEVWKSIPWQLSLLEAQKLALKDEKPIFIWAMDGHALGCT